jgi:hypothetical protein
VKKDKVQQDWLWMLQRNDVAGDEAMSGVGFILNMNIP